MRGFECVIHQLVVQILHMTDGVICTGFAAAILTKRVTSEQWIVLSPGLLQTIPVKSRTSYKRVG